VTPEVKVVSTQGHFEALFADYAGAIRGQGPLQHLSENTEVA
jgi:alpha-1,6-mannosyltransferase